MKKVYVSLNKKAKEAKQIYVGVGNKAKKVKKLYVGDKGKAKLAFESAITIDDLEYMQDFAKFTSAEKKAIRDSMEVEKRYTLTDIRDNNQYQIARLKDGNIWMVDDLKFGGNEETVLTPDTSDVAAEWTLPASNDESFITEDAKDDSIPRFYIDREKDCYLYNWNAVTAGACVGRTTYGAQMFSSVLPCGWKLPMYSGIRELPSLFTTYGLNISGAYWKGEGEAFVGALGAKYPTYSIESDGRIVSYPSTYRRWAGTNGSNEPSGSLDTDKSYGIVLEVSKPTTSEVSTRCYVMVSNSSGEAVRGVVRIDEDYAGQRDKRNWRISDIKYMQDFARLTAAEKQAVRDSMILEQTYTLLDKRDNKPYEVARLKDDNIWMVQNLALGSNDHETVIEKKNSDFDSADTFTLPQGSNTSGFGSNSRNYESIYLDEVYEGYYTPYLATIRQRDYNTMEETTESILPRAWRIPRAEEANTLVTLYEDKMLEAPVSFKRGGRYYYNGSSRVVSRTGEGNYGSYLTSSVLEGSSSMQIFYARETNSKAQGESGGYNNGFNIRGIVRIDEDYTGRLLSGESA